MENTGQGEEMRTAFKGLAGINHSNRHYIKHGNRYCIFGVCACGKNMLHDLCE